MGRYRVHYIEGSGENLRIRKEQTVEAPSFQAALERFTPVSYTHLTLPTNREV